MDEADVLAKLLFAQPRRTYAKIPDLAPQEGIIDTSPC